MELLPCKECGEDAILIEYKQGEFFGRVRRRFKCPKNKQKGSHWCQTRSGTNKEAIQEWNEKFGGTT